jgi:Ras-related protein Rab-8A
MEGQAGPRPLQMGAKGAYIVRLLMVGDSSCGKTSLVLRFDQNVFSTKFVTTIGVDYRDKMVKVSFINCMQCNAMQCNAMQCNAI